MDKRSSKDPGEDKSLPEHCLGFGVCQPARGHAGAIPCGIAPGRNRVRESSTSKCPMPSAFRVQPSLPRTGWITWCLRCTESDVASLHTAHRTPLARAGKADRSSWRVAQENANRDLRWFGAIGPGVYHHNPEGARSFHKAAGMVESDLHPTDARLPPTQDALTGYCQTRFLSKIVACCPWQRSRWICPPCFDQSPDQ